MVPSLNSSPQTSVHGSLVGVGPTLPELLGAEVATGNVVFPVFPFCTGEPPIVTPSALLSIEVTLPSALNHCASGTCSQD